ncbi:MAG TPA: AsmA-like C-terminal region-containing protein, partial [Gammaproteobacteria bacterium]|nr:AsmA-like C-terminal region-containing protein [Gammaproteobacteria bacterium]
LADVATNIKIADGQARLDKAGAKLYGGRFDGSFDAKTASGHSGLSLAGRAVGVDLAPLIAALTGEKANFSGRGDFDLQLSGQGAKVIDNVRSASGKVKFSLENGAIDGFNLGRTLCAVYNVTQKLPAPADQPKLTPYRLVSGTATVSNGVASSSDLLARASFMDVSGSGRLKLAEQQLDYTLEAKLTGKIGIAGCESMQPLIGESIPLTLRGTVTNPSISPDFHEIIERRVKKELQHRLQDRLEQRLKGLL